MRLFKPSIKIIISIFFFLGITLLTNLNASVVKENRYIRLTLSENGEISIYDKLNQVFWTSAFPGWVELSGRDGREEKISLGTSSIKISDTELGSVLEFNGLSGEEIIDKSFKMVVRIKLFEKKIDFEISDLKTTYLLESVEYPAHLISVKSGVEDGYIVVPHLQGIMIPSRYDAGFMRYGQNVWETIADIEKWWDFESGNLNMPWFGATRGNSSILVHVLTSSDCILHTIGNAVVGKEGLTLNNRQGQKSGIRMSSLTPIWLSSKKALSYPRKMSLELVEGGYVGMAKKYREYAVSEGKFITLKQKIEEYPEYEKIIGAPDIKIYCFTNRKNEPVNRAWSEPVLNGYTKVNTTFEQVGQIADDLEQMGIEKCLILLAGWNRMGYDREHPDVWPPSKKAGGTNELKATCEKVIDKGYLFAFHDNYDDMYPDAPSYDEKSILRHYDGSLEFGGIWDGGLCQIICPAERKEFVNRNLDLIQENIPLNAYYLDVITNTSHYECYDNRHPVTRKEDLNYRLEIIKSLQERGLVVGGERGTEWALPVVGFCEGLSGGGTGYHRGMCYRTGLTIPLFYLVYRECVVGYWQHGTPYGREDHANHVLLDLLNIQPSSWSVEYDQWDDLRPLIRETYELLGRLHEETAHEEMIEHEILSNDHMVQQSIFSDGTQIRVNFGITAYSFNGITLPPKGFWIKRKGKAVIKGIAGRHIKYLE